jgi:hypothetical protein
MPSTNSPGLFYAEAVAVAKKAAVIAALKAELAFQRSAALASTQALSELKLAAHAFVAELSYSDRNPPSARLGGLKRLLEIGSIERLSRHMIANTLSRAAHYLEWELSRGLYGPEDFINILHHLSNILRKDKLDWGDLETINAFFSMDGINVKE